MQYEIMRTVMGGRELFAPLEDPKKILDIGTGTGTWPIAMGTVPALSFAHLPASSFDSPPQIKLASRTWS